MQQFKAECKRTGGHFTSMLIFMESHDALRPVYKQLLWQVGQRIQANMFQLAKSGVVHSGITVAHCSISDVLDIPAHLDRRLSCYVSSGVSAALGHLNFTCCSDKAAVGGLGAGVQSTMFVLPLTDQAILGIPQVSANIKFSL